MAGIESWLKNIELIYKQNEHHFAEIFQHLHQNPELSRHEEKTSNYIQSLITQNTKFKILHTINHGFLSGYEERKRPTLCLRGDMDALPIEEKTSLPYISNVKGIMHACGHDFHSTAVYAVAFLWDKIVGPFPKAPVFLFQHAEEPIPGGALDFIENKIHEEFDEIFGFHVEPNLKTGNIGLSEGWVNAQSIKFDVTILGSGGHSARPWDGYDPLKAGIDIIQKLYADLPRETDIKNPFVFSVTQFNSDNKAYNVIPQSVKWGGTLRVTNTEVGEKLIQKIDKTIKSYCKLNELSYEFKYHAGAPPVINSKKSIGTTHKLKDFLMSKNWKFEHYQSLGGEDFGWFNQLMPGFLIRVGVTPEGSDAIPLHTEYFKADFSALRNIVSFYMLYFIERAGLVSQEE